MSQNARLFRVQSIKSKISVWSKSFYNKTKRMLIYFELDTFASNAILISESRGVIVKGRI